MELEIGKRYIIKIGFMNCEITVNAFSPNRKCVSITLDNGHTEWLEMGDIRILDNLN